MSRRPGGRKVKHVRVPPAHLLAARPAPDRRAGQEVDTLAIAVMNAGESAFEKRRWMSRWQLRGPRSLLIARRWSVCMLPHVQSRSMVLKLLWKYAKRSHHLRVRVRYGPNPF